MTFKSHNLFLAAFALQVVINSEGKVCSAHYTHDEVYRYIYAYMDVVA